MLFQIDFNHSDFPKNQDEILKQLGTYVDKEEYDYYEVEINTLEELRDLQNKCRQLTGEKYFSMLINVDEGDDNDIYFDCKS